MATIQSGGRLILSDLTPFWARSYYQPGMGVELSGRQAAYGAIYQQQLWAYVVVNKLANAQARLPLKVYEKGTSGRVERPDSAYARLLRRPNSQHDPYFFWLWTISTRCIYGEAMWAKFRDLDGIVRELYPIHPTNIYIRKDDDDKLVYVYHLGNAAQPVYEFAASDIVHFKTYKPDSSARGLSPFEPLRQTLLNEDAARRASSSFWQNAGRPSVALS
ncbi:MAG: phage portal protein, partial [Actinobacteria bacterium]|nr:phage portal protein [Actinomycetota bacterium]